ncbi:MAG: hypothetical protein J7L77_03670 [Clostridiales bacterium]|nr:hypothetical protein [Clostridiales bacterium]
MKNNIKYIFILFGSAALLLLSVAGFNTVVDPFGMYRLIDIEDFNANKPAIYNRVRLLKAYEVRRIKPESIVLGTSRVHLGINPSHEGWSALYAHRYNLAFDGATTKEMYYYLVHANATKTLKHVMLGLDTYHLSAAPGSTRPDFDPTLLRNEYHGLNAPRMMAADFKILTSIDTFKESLQTLKVQNDDEAVWLAPDGQRIGEVFFRRPYENFMTRGPRYYFDEIDKLEVRFKLEWKIPSKPGQTLPLGPPPKTDPITSLGYIEKIIAFCRSHDIKLAIFLTPSHVHQLELDALTDNWGSIESGKRQIASILTKDAEEHYDKETIPLYDFTLYSDITTESLPPENSHEEMSYYWDSSHFKENVGDMVLDRLFGIEKNESLVMNNFGLKLTPENVEHVIKDLRKKHEEYQHDNATEINTIKKWVSDFKRDNNIK